MMSFAILTPDLRERLARSASAAFFRRLETKPDLSEPAIEKALSGAPNAKAVARAAARLRRVPGILGVGTGRRGGDRILVFRDRYFTRIDRRRLTSDGLVREYESVAVAYRKSNVAFQWGRAPRRATESMVYFEAHAITRFIERGPLDQGGTTARDARLSLPRDHCGHATGRVGGDLETAGDQPRRRRAGPLPGQRRDLGL